MNAPRGLSVPQAMRFMHLNVVVLIEVIEKNFRWKNFSPKFLITVYVLLCVLFGLVPGGSCWHCFGSVCASPLHVQGFLLVVENGGTKPQGLKLAEKLHPWVSKMRGDKIILSPPYGGDKNIFFFNFFFKFFFHPFLVKHFLVVAVRRKILKR